MPLDGADSAGPILAIDIGGTKMAVGVVDNDGELLEREQVPTPDVGDAEGIWRMLAELIGRFAPFDHFGRCGIGCGGPMSADGELVSTLNIPAWRSFPIAARVRDLTGLKVGLENDAKALALAEGWVGAAVGCANYLAMVVSTGVGGGIVLDGRLLDGVAGNAGHIGHVVVEPVGSELAGHVRGVLESEASGTGIAARIGRPAHEADADEIERSGRLVGRAVGSAVNLLDLERCLVGGSVALGFGAPFFAAAQTEMDRICQLDYSRGRRVEPVGCGDRGPLIGAAAIARFVRCN